MSGSIKNYGPIDSGVIGPVPRSDSRSRENGAVEGHSLGKDAAFSHLGS